MAETELPERGEMSGKRGSPSVDAPLLSLIAPFSILRADVRANLVRFRGQRSLFYIDAQFAIRHFVNQTLSVG
jgi:hypothetical protein